MRGVDSDGKCELGEFFAAWIGLGLLRFKMLVVEVCQDLPLEISVGEKASDYG